MSALQTVMAVAGVSVLVLCASVACGAEDHERIAEAAALGWTADEAERISEEIAAEMTRMRGRALPVTVQVFNGPSSSGRSVQTYQQTLRSAADAGEIRDTLEWAFGAPTRKPDGRYAIIATASVSFEIAPIRSDEILREVPGGWFPTTSHRGSVDYEIEIDTAARDVTSSIMLLKSVRITQLPREGTGDRNFRIGGGAKISWLGSPTPGFPPSETFA